MSIWTTIDRLVDECTDEAALHTHGLNLWAARQWHAAGREVSTDLKMYERAAVMAAMSAPAQLSWIRQVLDGPIILLKGPEVAARYPDPFLRPYGDLDLLVPDAAAAQQELIAAGCTEVTEKAPHHLPALRCPGSQLFVEIHERPKTPQWTRLSMADLFASAVPSVVSVDGILTIPPAQHAVLLAAHSWTHEPFGRLGELADVAAMSEGVDEGELKGLAGQWGLARVWSITCRAIEALGNDEDSSRRRDHILWNHLHTLRVRTPAESMLATQVSHFWAPLSVHGIKSMTRRLSVLPYRGTKKLYRLARQEFITRTAYPAQMESTVENT